MKKILITVFILFNTIAAYCQHHPYIQDLKSEAQITFPDTPKVKFDDGATYYSYTDSNIYFAEFIDLHKINPDSINSQIRNDIYNKFISGAISPLKGNLFYNEKIEIKGLKGVAFNYKCNLKGNTYYAYQQVFQLKNALISYSLLSPDSLSAVDKKVKSFFGTFKLTPAKATQLDKDSNMMAGIFITAAFLFWSSIIFYVVRRKKKKKIYEWSEER